MELRRIAILISQMDSETADMLLADLPAEQRTKIMSAVESLTDVTDSELAAVAQELQEVAVADEVDDLCGEHGLPLSHTVSLDRISQLPMSFGEDGLTTVIRASSVERLLSVLHEEYPQTLAAVAARLSPEDAAKFLSGLADSVRADVIGRIAALESTDEDVVRELAEEIASRLDAELTRVDGSLVGRDAVKAILFASKGDQRNRLIKSLTTGEPRLAVQLGVAPTGDVADEPKVSEPHASDPPTNDPSATRTVDQESPLEQHWTFERVLRLPPKVLANVVRSAAFEVVLLALVGTSPAQSEHFLCGLPASESSRFRRRLSAVGPVRLRDIEVAQRQLTHAAQRVVAGSAPQVKTGRKGITLSV